MSYTSRFRLPLCVAGCIFAVAAQESTRPQLTARELFYSAASAPAPAAKAPPQAAPQAPPKAPAQAAPKKAASAPAQTATGDQQPPRKMTPPHIVVGRIPIEIGRA